MDKGQGKVIQFKNSGSGSYSAEAEREQNVIGARIAEARRKSGMSLVAFSRCLRNYGVSVGDGGLSKWETGSTVPNAYQLMAICCALGIENEQHYFMGDYQPPLNEIGMRKVQDYRADLIASGG